jgi:hypothetical protein
MPARLRRDKSTLPDHKFESLVLGEALAEQFSLSGHIREFADAEAMEWQLVENSQGAVQGKRGRSATPGGRRQS